MKIECKYRWPKTKGSNQFPDENGEWNYRALQKKTAEI